MDMNTGVCVYKLLVELRIGRTYTKTKIRILGFVREFRCIITRIGYNYCTRIVSLKIFVISQCSRGYHKSNQCRYNLGHMPIFLLIRNLAPQNINQDSNMYDWTSSPLQWRVG